MCGRYYVDDETAREIERVVKKINSDLNSFTSGEVRPSERAMVIAGRTKDLSAEVMNWGFQKYQSNGLMINARAETAKEKVSFRESVLKRRCIIPARHYYEWDSEKNKVTFYRNDSRVIYMAGFYNRFTDGDHFIILTTEANNSVRNVHDRMPLILEEKELQDWIYDDSYLNFALTKKSPELVQYQEYVQQSLF